jgi:hypothetical protein
MSGIERDDWRERAACRGADLSWFFPDRDGILRSTFDLWCRVYDELKSVPGSNDRARTSALRYGWAPPGAWDESTIDDPNALPRLEVAA